MLKFLGTEILLNLLYNSGSFLGFLLLIQIMSGLIMVLFYSPESFLAFNSVQYIMYESYLGWFFRLLHFNGVSMFFVMIYIHFLKAFYYKSYNLKETWILGLMMLLFFMMEAFLGYTLVWAQMSFWAGTVITNLLSVIPLFGNLIVILLWSGYFMNSMTVKFFFLLHFILPFLLFIFIYFHIYFLHFYSSSSKLGFTSKQSKYSFYPFYWMKDLLNLIFYLIFVILMLFFPFKLSDPLMFEEVNELISPIHIIPEWYFTWVYAILRAVTNKILGIMMMLMSILIFFIFIFKKSLLNYNKIWKLLFFIMILILLILSWLGSLEAMNPFIYLSLLFVFFYFLLMIIFFIN